MPGTSGTTKGGGPVARPARGVAAVRTALFEMRDRLDVLLVELGRVEGDGGPSDEAQRAPAPDLDSEGPIVCLKVAAEAIGWRRHRLVPAMIRHNERCPDDPLGWQAGGNRRGPWEVRLGRLKRWVRDRPDRPGNRPKPTEIGPDR